MNQIPVYLFTGFLEGGKTKFIQETMEDPNFNDGEATLLLLCEEGEEEYDLFRFKNGGEGVTLRTVDDVTLLTEDRLEAMRKRANAERVIIEYNGMWSLDPLYNAMPKHWTVAQELWIADATTVLGYNANMRQLTVDKLQSVEVVIFNRVVDATDRMALHKLVRGVSRRAKIAYETLDGDLEFDQIEDPLPFDINAPVIEIADRDYALWYRDISEETDKYHGKRVAFKGIVAKNAQLGKDEFALGRHVMVCCQDDIAYRAFLAKSPRASAFSSYDWVTVTADIRVEKSAFYGGRGPVLHILTIDPAEKPEQELATFD